MNCHGCKWLDRYKMDGNGYCCHVVMSKTYFPSERIILGRLLESASVRRPDMERCELYEAGDWAKRWEREQE